MKYTRKLVLADGTSFLGNGFGHTADVVCEIVFHTGMAGYEGVITDGAYENLGVVMTYPTIGNFGVSQKTMDTKSNGLTALIVKEHCHEPSNWQSVATIETALKEKNIVGMTDVDTRALAIKLRESGTMKGIIVNVDVADTDALEQLKTAVTTAQPKQTEATVISATEKAHTVALIDFGGENEGIIEELLTRGCDVHLLPIDVTVETIKEVGANGIFLSNGPEKEISLSDVTVVTEMAKQFPVFGLGYGYQVLATAMGATVAKMALGHRGENTPVKDIATGKTLITSQNHGYTVDKDSLENTDLTVTHVAINDETVQGIAHKTLPVFGVQFKADVHTGLADAAYLFDKFVNQLGGNKNA